MPIQPNDPPRARGQRLLRPWLGAIALATLLLGAGAGLAAPEAPIALTILHTNDLHDHLESERGEGGHLWGGAARRASLVAGLRARTPNLLVLDAGDAFQGTPLYTAFHGEVDYRVMAAIGYDALAVGNHDLDDGIVNLERQAHSLAAPPLCANLCRTGGPSVFPGTRFIRKGGLTIALVGVLGPSAFGYVDRRVSQGPALVNPVAELRGRVPAPPLQLALREPADVLRELVPSLRRRADLVVVLSHLGHAEELALAAAVPGIDVIVGGHSHTRVDHPVVVMNAGRPTLVAQAFHSGHYVGRIDLGVLHGRLVRYAGELLPVTESIAPDPAVAALVASYTRKIAPLMARVVAHAPQALGLENKHHADFPLGNLVTDAYRSVTGAEIAIKESGGIRSGMPRGAITVGQVTSMLPMGFHLVTGTLSGAAIAELLRQDVANFDKDDTFQFSGLSFVVKQGLVAQVRVGRALLEPQRNYRVVTTDYLALGNGHAEVLRAIHDVQDTGLLEREGFLRYVQTHRRLVAPPATRIRREPG